MLIPLAVELTKVADIQDLEFSQAFENIFATLEALKNEEDGKMEVSLPVLAVEKGTKRKRQRKITCIICGQKLQTLAGKHLKKHGITIKEYREIGMTPTNEDGAANYVEVQE